MAIVASRVDVTTSATVIAQNTASASAADTSIISLVAKNVTGTASVFLGPSGVTTSTGLEWTTTDGPFSFDLEPGESLYGIVASTQQTLHILKGGR